MDEGVQVACTASEATKLLWLLNVISGVDEMQKRFKSDKDWYRSNEYVSVSRHVDWRQVVNYCFPQLLVIMLQDASNERDKFEDFPIYAVVCRSGQMVPLQDEVTIVPEAGDSQQGVNVEEAISSLLIATEGIKEANRAEAKKLLGMLRRVMRSTK